MYKKISSVGIFFVGLALLIFSVTNAFAAINIVFPDVDYNAYYGDSLSKMVANGIVTGYEDGTFGPNDAVTRAQIVTILDRYDNQLVNAYRVGGVGEIQTLLCNGFSETDFEGLSGQMAGEDPLGAYQSVCSM